MQNHKNNLAQCCCYPRASICKIKPCTHKHNNPFSVAHCYNLIKEMSMDLKCGLHIAMKEMWIDWNNLIWEHKSWDAAFSAECKFIDSSIKMWIESWCNILYCIILAPSLCIITMFHQSCINYLIDNIQKYQGYLRDWLD